MIVGGHIRPGPVAPRLVERIVETPSKRPRGEDLLCGRFEDESNEKLGGWLARQAGDEGVGLGQHLVGGLVEVYRAAERLRDVVLGGPVASMRFPSGSRK